MDLSWHQDLSTARGVTRWRREIPLGALEGQVRRLGRRPMLLDGTDVEGKSAFLALCEQVFALPDWFGHNWDALEECLADLEVGPGVVVLWSGWELFADTEPDEYATAVDVFADTARRLAVEGASFVVLILGEGDDDTDDDEDDEAADDDDDDAADDGDEDVGLEGTWALEPPAGT